MKVFHALERVECENSAVAIGNFDGLHRGHEALIARLVREARAQSLAPTVLTFYPHPVEVLNPQKKLERLSTTSEKLEHLEALGIERVLVAPFDRDVASLTPEEFFDRYLKTGLFAKRIHVGFNFRFGKERRGDTAMLARLSEKAGIAFHCEEAFEYQGQKVSSSLIRELIRGGKVNEAGSFLGRPYSLTGTVSRGDERGRNLGFPTANLHCPLEKLLPKNGVYVTVAEWQKQYFRSVSNVGVRPTFQPESITKLVEVHILDFSQRIYDETLKVQFWSHLRDERKFSGVDELKTAIGHDVESARRYQPKPF